MSIQDANIEQTNEADYEPMWTDEELVGLIAYRPLESGAAYVERVRSMKLVAWHIPNMDDPVAYVQALRDMSDERRGLNWRIT